ncbi:MAG: hypothetical protein AAGI91_16120 [Bacteroidota bacterium]
MLFLVFGLAAAGCVPGSATVRYDHRGPAARHALPRAEHRARARVSRDARRHVRELDRVLRLDRRQERRIALLLTDRAVDRLRRTSPRNWSRANPFPRRYADRSTWAWWHRTDRRIERELDVRQRRLYREVVRRSEYRARRQADRYDDGYRGRD